MKLAHYLHIAPRLLFMAQGLATLIGAIVQCGVTVFMITRIEGICTPDAEGGFTCPHGRVTYSSSLIWGTYALFQQWTRLTNRCPRSTTDILSWRTLQRITLVLPRGPGSGLGDIPPRPTLEESELPLLARRVRSHESRPTSYRNQFLLLVDSQRRIQRAPQTTMACVVVEIQYARPPYPRPRQQLTSQQTTFSLQRWTPAWLLQQSSSSSASPSRPGHSAGGEIPCMKRPRTQRGRRI